MNTLQYENHEICIKEAPSYNPNSVDNKHYDKIITIEEADFNRYIEIEVTSGDKIKSVLFMAPYYTPIDTCAACHAKGLVLMLDSILCLFDSETLDIIQKVKIDALGSMFEIHSYKGDFILYGELEIYRISSDLKVMWKFCSRDILVRYKGTEPAFKMLKDKICLTDFADNYYEITYDGELLMDRPLVP